MYITDFVKDHSAIDVIDPLRRGSLFQKRIERDKPVGILQYECFGNNVCVDFVSLALADVIFTHDRGFDGVQHTYVEIAGYRLIIKSPQYLSCIEP